MSENLLVRGEAFSSGFLLSLTPVKITRPYAIQDVQYKETQVTVTLIIIYTNQKPGVKQENMFHIYFILFAFSISGRGGF
jgi:hypothetical protein